MRPNQIPTGDPPAGTCLRAAAPLLGSLLLAAATLVAQPVPQASALASREEMERFLASAEILEMWEVGIGVTGSKRATLSDGHLTHDAHVQTVDVFLKKFTSREKSEFNFRDYWGFNVAAYRLDKLLDLGMVPVSVAREVDGQEASVTWWVDGVVMSMGEYQEGDRKPPSPTRFDDQRRLAWAFQQLVLNRDPNLGNDVIDESWKVWLIDFTRAFRPWKKLDDVKILTRVPRRFYDNLRALDPEAVERELGPFLKKNEVKGLLARRDRLIEHYDARIRQHGEAVVFIDWPVP